MRGNLFVTTVLLLLLLSGISFARPFPIVTNDTVAPFADQPEFSSMSDAQIQFFAQNFYGTQKLYANQISQLRAYNPNFLMLHYRLGQSAGSAPGIAHDADSDGSVNGNVYSSEEWTSYTQNQDWYILGSDGQRLYQTQWNWYPFDLGRSQVVRNQVADYWVRRATEEARATGSDGIFADSSGQLFGPWQNTNALPNYVPGSPTFTVANGQNWLSNAYVPYSLRVWQGMQAQNLSYLPNVGQLITSWDSINNYLNSDGAMVEGFAGFGSSIADVNDWRLEMNNVLTLSRNNKIVIAQTSLDAQNDLTRRSFIAGSYLLSKGPKSYLFMYSGSTLEWYPEYDLDLGAYVDMPANVDSLVWNGVYRRNFEKGMVLVNPSGSNMVVNLGTTYNLAQFQGGGAIPVDGSRAGSITYQSVNQVTIPAQGAVFLLNIQGAPIDADQDGYTFAVDCNDNNAQVNPGRNEVPGNGVDDDCNVNTPDSILSPTNQTGLIATIGSDSSIYYNERDAAVTGATHFIINPVVGNGLGTQLADNQGLYIYTPRVMGRFYYRVVASNGQAVANVAAFHRSGQTFLTWTENGAASYAIYRESNQQAGSVAVDETNDPIQPVLVWQDNGARVYTLFLPQDSWNRELFRGQGLNFFVGVPQGYNYASPSRLPVVIHQEGRSSRYTNNNARVGTGGSPYDITAVYVRLDDPDLPTYSQGWYFGHYCNPQNPQEGVCNYLENAYIEFILALQRNAQYNIDQDRIYDYGHSMGGTAALRFGMRYPDIFAGIYASEPVTNFDTVADLGGTNWEADVADSRGTSAQNLPFHPVGVSRNYLLNLDGQGVWTVENMIDSVCRNQGKNTALITLAHGTADDSVDTDTQGYSFYQAANRCHLGFQAQITSGGHSWQGFAGMGQMLDIFGNHQFRKASFPAFSNAQNSKDPSTTGTGSFNQDLVWALRQDTATVWESEIRSTTTDQQVDVTPRRSRLVVLPNQQFFWERRNTQGTVLASGSVQADPYGVVTVPRFLATTSGSVLVLTAGQVAPDITPPVISVPTTTPGTTTAQVVFTTNELSTVRLDYGTTRSYGQVMNLPSNTQFSVNLVSLAPSTTYYYQVTATDSAGNSQTLNGQFTTSALVVDADGDGYNSNADCNDANAQVNPGHAEVLGNGIDDDCNSSTPDQVVNGSLQTVTLVSSADSYLYPSYSNTGRQTNLKMYQEGNTASQTRLLVRFNISLIPADAVITNAQLKLYHVGSSFDTAARNVAVCALSQNWVEGTGTHEFDAGATGVTWTSTGTGVNWNIAGGSCGADFASAPVPYRATSIYDPVRFVVFDVTSQARSSNGYLVHSISGNWRQDDFAPREAADPNVRPQLVVTYSLPVLDVDGDGYDANTDCNDHNTQINPSMAEVLYDGIDNDCNPNTLDYVDVDQDSFRSNVDCDDTNPRVNPGALEILYDQIDNDCNVNTPDTVDADQDTFNSNVDCNDTNTQINPGMAEVLYDGVDNDCNVQTLDFQGYSHFFTIEEIQNYTSTNLGDSHMFDVKNEFSYFSFLPPQEGDYEFIVTLKKEGNPYWFQVNVRNVLEGRVTHDLGNISDNSYFQYSTQFHIHPVLTQVRLYGGARGGSKQYLQSVEIRQIPPRIDVDQDGFVRAVDCDDTNAQINPGMAEVLYDGVDNDCNANTPDMVDADADGFNSNVDCNDADARVNPGAQEVLGNGIDDDCTSLTPDVLQTYNLTLYAVEDAYVFPSYGNTGKQDILKMYREADVASSTHLIVKFDTSSIPQGARVVRARLELYPLVSQFDSAVREASVCALSQNWVEGTGTHEFDAGATGVTWTSTGTGTNWNTAGGSCGPVISSALVSYVAQASFDESRFVGFDVTSQARSSYGFMILPTSGNWRQDNFAPRETPDARMRPRLIIEYQ